MSDLFPLAVCLDASMEGTGGRYDGPLYSLSGVEHYLRDLSCVQKTNQVTTTKLPPRSGPRRSLDVGA